MGESCYHCGDPCGASEVVFDDKPFCCHGCRTVYEIFNDNGLTYYYDLQQAAGTTPNEPYGKFDFLDNADIVSKLLEFDADGIRVVNLHLPQIHCSSCIWLLENLKKLETGVRASMVDFPKKKVRITFDAAQLSLKQLVLLLARIGYEPLISMDDYGQNRPKTDRSLLYKLGVAGFAFGNVMLLSFPEYFASDGFWLDRYKPVFRWAMFVLSLPVVFYAAQDYFLATYKGLRSKNLTIDVPIALGIVALFLRSTVDIAFDLGSGFFDSLTGLVFFLLVGRFFQQKTYAFLSFERDYKSYFPIGVTKINDASSEETIEIYKVAPGDRLLVRNQEIIPVDCVLISGQAQIDYSFVTGESETVAKNSGDRLYAGGMQRGGPLQVEALKSVSQSYLTQLWGNSVFSKNRSSGFQSLTDAFGKRFTMAVLTIATLATLFWLWHDPARALNVFTAVLIIACPCAIALAAPFALGNMLRIFGRNGLYLKDTSTIERMAKVATVVFDKTGTLTTSKENTVEYNGVQLTDDEAAMLKTTLRGSNHPLSRSLYLLLREHDIQTLDAFEEHAGKGLEGKTRGRSIKVGSPGFVGAKKTGGPLGTSVHVGTESGYKGYFSFGSKYREGIAQLFSRLGKNVDLVILSGDNDSGRAQLEKLLPFSIPMFFYQKPKDKLDFVGQLQKSSSVMMVGDGLNDAGALAMSDVGVAVAEDINVFSPACDAILDASKVVALSDFLRLSKVAIRIVKASFLLSLCYNVIGLTFAVTGRLEPVVAAILMPLSSISIVVFTTLLTNFFGDKMKK